MNYMIDAQKEDDSGPTTSSLVSDILRIYNLEESPTEEYKKIMENGELPNTAIVQYLSKNFAAHLISEKDFINSLVEKLSIPNDIAEKIVKNIIEKVVPFIKSLSSGNAVTEKRTTTVQIGPINSVNKIEPPLRSKITKATIKPIEDVNIKKIPQGPDGYREPIE